MQNINFYTTPSLIVENDALRNKLGDICRSFAAKKVLIITDKGIAQLGYAQLAVEALNARGIDAKIFDQVVADPPTSVVNEALQLAREYHCDAVIGLGGGSSLDTAKIIALYDNDFAKVEDILGKDIVSFGRKPLIAIPTTAGTGSEVTFVSVLTTDDGNKSAIYSPKILPDVAILDASLTLELPRSITSASALDAMVHAIEAYTSRTKKNSISDALAIQGLKLLWKNFPLVLDNGRDADARANMLLGSTLAGIAFVNSSVAAVHGLSYPLGVRFHVPHGHANALVMIPVFKYNLPAACGLYAELARAVMPEKCQGLSDMDAATVWLEQLNEYFENSGLKTKLSQLGITEQDVPQLAADMVQNYSRLIATNPRDMDINVVEQLYSEVLF